MNVIPLVLIGLLVTTSLSRAQPAPRAEPTVRPAASVSGHRPSPDSLTDTRDPILRLQAQLASGAVKLTHDSAMGYLPAILKALKIPVSSQGLVFSRTSLRTDLIAPWSPRALYFNDDVYIGWVPESEFLEIASVNPTDGVSFYTFSQERDSKPVFTRETNRCLMCHQSAITGRVPGLLMNTTVTDRSGYPLATVRYGTMTDETPTKHRFGGWYVTGSIANAVHSGNVFSTKDFNQVDRSQGKVDIDLTTESHLTTLAAKLDTTRYLSGQSDVVGLMVQVHQTAVHTLISATHDAARRALSEQKALDQYNGTTASVPLAVSNPRLRGAVERLVRAMLFIDEAKWDGTMSGPSTFARDFAALGPRDSQGRSLRDFNLHDRLFKYPLSFLIYSEGFNMLPDVAKQGVYLRLRSILNDREQGPEYLRLSDVDRKAVLEILNDTKPEFVKAAW